ncbi:MAG: hypothetical protein UR93_C0030G0002 [Berkelbacteria bacterium GW2011_GWA2_35_9]|uniref:Uncharacterized protein n=1 Tax=Berkelbacteria bacterium GW2011_GWA2_35_9 TaxID=1618333 RepID=A0A0G0D0L1_9BACT|nr:MAG: hypothetical protein UR93_C0030G0002 [Berkelbacteria bacterium GW2011_GWA2_35_9]
MINLLVQAKESSLKKYTQFDSGSTGKLATLDDPAKITAFIFNTVISLSGAIFMIMLLVGGITYLTGAGNDEQTGKAKKIMIDATIGLILTLGAYGIGKMVIDQLS